MASRSKFSSEFKSRVALEALKERETLAELSTRFEVSQEMISRWKGESLTISNRLGQAEPSVEVKALKKGAPLHKTTAVGGDSLQID